VKILDDMGFDLQLVPRGARQRSLLPYISGGERHYFMRPSAKSMPLNYLRAVALADAEGFEVSDMQTHACICMFSCVCLHAHVPLCAGARACVRVRVSVRVCVRVCVIVCV